MPPLGPTCTSQHTMHHCLPHLLCCHGDSQLPAELRGIKAQLAVHGITLQTELKTAAELHFFLRGDPDCVSEKQLPETEQLLIWTVTQTSQSPACLYLLCATSLTAQNRTAILLFAWKSQNHLNSLLCFTVNVTPGVPPDHSLKSTSSATWPGVPCLSTHHSWGRPHTLWPPTE